MHYRLSQLFFARDTHIVARALLGKLLVRRWHGQELVGRITEVESYVGEDDAACHASHGKTARNEVMFCEAGHAYVYLIYGMYNCLNVVTERKDFPAAVLIRSLEPLHGIATMQKLRRTDNIYHVTTGPGKLTKAFAITRRLNGEDLTISSQLFVADDGYQVPKSSITISARIGVDYAGKHAALPWRYYLKNSPFVSKSYSVIRNA